MKTKEELIVFYKNHFRIITNWYITSDAHPKGKYTDRVNWNNKTKVANIFPLTKEYDFENYIFHEVLHICQAELNIGSTKERREKEEIFIVDLCRLKEYAQNEQPEISVTDEEIHKYAKEVFILANMFSEFPEQDRLMPLLQGLYSDGAKAMRDGKIKQNGQSK